MTDRPTAVTLPPPARVPATLDLAEHGRLALNGMLGALDPAADFESTFLNILDVHPAYMLHWSSMVSGVMPKYMEALPLLRLMSGSPEHRDLETGFVEAMLRNAAEDGLIYDRASAQRPWNVGVFYGRADWNEDYANMAGNGRWLAGLLFWHQWTGEDAWLAQARRTAERMLELAIVEGERAWYPNPGLGNDFSYPRTSGWTTTKAPAAATEGFEGASMFYLFQPLRGWARYYQASGDERYLDLSRRFINTGLQEHFWSGAGDMAPAASAERGRFRIHFHASMAAVRGVLDYALAAGDHTAMEFALNSYLYARQMGLARLGLFPTGHGGTEGCSIADMVGMAVTLSDAGLGDFWDDVEMYARNGLVEVQATDLPELQRVSREGRERPPGAPFGGHFDGRFSQANNKGVLPGQEVHDRVLERTLGAFGHLVGARYQTPMMMHCCTANGAQGLYYAWEGILRREGDGVAVNLWLNRRSPWADVWSWLPHEGRLVVQNKGMRRIAVRPPAWVRRRDLHCWVDARPATPEWRGNRLVFDGLTGAERITVEAPCPLQRARYTLVNVGDPLHSCERYAIAFRGHTAVEVEPLEPPAPVEGPTWYGEGERNWYRVFRRDSLRRERAELAPVPPYVHPEKLVRWGVA